MLKATKTAVMAILRTDPNITPERLNFIRAAMDGKPAEAAAPADALLKPAEVAALIKRTKKTVMELASKGVFRRVYAPGGRHALGITAASVRAFLNGGTTTTESEAAV